MKRVLALEGQAKLFEILLLIRDRGEVYAQMLKSKDRIAPRTYYRVLHRLLDLGLIDFRLDDSAEGAFRKMYHLTPHGETFIAQLEGMEKILCVSMREARERPEKSRG